VSPAELRIARGLFAPEDTPSAQSTELPQEGSQEAIDGFSKELQSESWVSTQPRSEGLGHYVWKVLGFFGTRR